MAILEVQDKQEVMQVRSRELQLESVQKMNEEIIPVVENINNIDFEKIESDSAEIRDIVSQNLQEQPDLSELLEALNNVSKSISNMKGQITKVSNKITELSNTIDNLKE